MVELRSKEGSTAIFELKITGEQLAKARGEVYRKEVKRINIPGFRKGKAPQRIIEQYYGVEVFFDDAVNLLLPDLYESAVEKLSLDVVAQPDIEIEEISAGSGAILKIEVDCKPEVKLTKYKGIAIPKIDYTLTDEDIDHELQFMQQRYARIITTDGKVLAEGDTAIIDFEGFIDDQPFEGGKGENHPLEIGSNTFIPGFEEQLIGKKKGDAVDVKVTFPEDYHAPEFAGKPAVFKVEIKSVKTKELPALDDDFAKDTSEFDTLDELKADIREKKREEFTKKERRDTEDAIIDEIIDEKNMDADIPESMIKAEIGRIAQNLDHQLAHQGLSLEQYFEITGMTPNGFSDENYDRAKAQVKANLAIEYIANAEGIEASEAEIDAEYAKFVESNPGMTLETVKGVIKPEGMAHDIQVNKTLDFLIENAEIGGKK